MEKITLKRRKKNRKNKKDQLLDGVYSDEMLETDEMQITEINERELENKKIRDIPRPEISSCVLSPVTLNSLIGPLS